MGKKQGQQTVSNAPWGPVQAPLMQGITEAQRIYGTPMMGSRRGPNDPELNLVNSAATELQRTINGDRFGSNPYLEAMIQRAGADVNSQFSGMGRYGSGAHIDQLLSRAALPIRYQNYAQERQNQLNAVQQAEGMNQSVLGEPYGPLREYLSTIAPFAGAGGTQSSPIYRNQAAGALGGAAAAGGLASSAGLFGSATAAASPWAWPLVLAGGILGSQ